MTRRTSFLDTLTYARWGARTGIAIQAYKAAVDLLDKIAAFVHLYFNSGHNPRDVLFRTLPFTQSSKDELPEPFASALKAPERNRALIALMDLSSELGEDSQRTIQLRNAATHRFFVVHMELPPDRSAWTEHIGWFDLVRESVCQLKMARDAILYLAQMIDIHERASRENRFITWIDYALAYASHGYRSDGG